MHAIEIFWQVTEMAPLLRLVYGRAYKTQRYLGIWRSVERFKTHYIDDNNNKIELTTKVPQSNSKEHGFYITMMAMSDTEKPWLLNSLDGGVKSLGWSQTCFGNNSL